MKKIYVLDAFHPAGPAWLAQRAELIPFHDPRTAHWHADADGIMVRMTPLTQADFAKAARLKAVVKQGVGVDTIALGAARARGIVVANTPGINSEAVAELALALALSVARRVTQLDRMVRAGEDIERPTLLGTGLHGKTVGIIGMGNIGVRSAAKFQAAFACSILTYDPFYAATPGKDAWASVTHERIHHLDDFWPRVDVLTIHAPRTGATRHMVGTAQLAAMRKGAIVVNTSRGGIVDEAALCQSILSGHIFGAGIDVWEAREPPSPDHPLLRLPTVVATPHTGGGTMQTQERSSLHVAQELFKILEGGAPQSRVA